MTLLIRRLREFGYTERAARPGRRIGRDFEKLYSWEGEELPLLPRTFIDGVRRRLSRKMSGEPPVLPVTDRRADADAPTGAGDADEEAPLPAPADPPGRAPGAAGPPADHFVSGDIRPGDGRGWVVCEVLETPAGVAAGSVPQIGTIVSLVGMIARSEPRSRGVCVCV